MSKEKQPTLNDQPSRLSQMVDRIKPVLPDTSLKWLAVLCGSSVGVFFFPEIHQIWRHYLPKPGEIYLESPEIYTRERMINERLTEDSWLREQLIAAGQLKISNPTQSFIKQHSVDTRANGPKITATNSKANTTGKNNTDQKTAKTETDKGKEKAQSGPPGQKKSESADRISNLDLAFGQLFKLRSSARSLVRQRLIENRLDDRHDIDENTLYVMKFDTTVVDAPINQRRAKIEVEISGPRGNPAKLQTSLEKDGTPRIRGPLKDSEITEIYLTYPDTIDLMHTTYEKWLKNVQLRIVENAFHRLKNSRRKTYTSRPNWRLRLQNDYHVGPSVLKHLSDDGAQRVFFAVEAIREVLQVQEGLFSVYFEADDPTVKIQQSTASKDNQKAPPSSKDTVTIRASALSPYALINVVLTPDNARDPGRYIHFLPRTHSVTVANKGCLQASYDPNVVIFSQGEFTLPGKADRSQSLDMVVFTPAEPVGSNLRLDLNVWPRTLIESVRREQEKRPTSANKLYAKDPLGTYSNITEYIKDGRIPGLPGLSIADPARSDELCHQVLPLTLNTGFIAFLRRMLRHRSFSYSVLPRDNAVVTLNEMKRIMALNFGPRDLTGANVKVNSEATSFELKPTLTTFGETAQDTQNPVVGWIIDPAASFPSMLHRSDYVTVTESVLAIVSVPAWWPQLNLEITRSWIDQRGGSGEKNGEGSLPRKIIVALPKDDRVLDTQLFGELQKKPRIERIEVGYPDPEAWAQACEKSLTRPSAKHSPPQTSLIVAGNRLWRNTVVTLGGRRASRIELMPDMRGVIAYFDCPIDFSRNASISVWTSEGAHSASLCRTPGTPDDIVRPWRCTKQRDKTSSWSASQWISPAQ